MRSALCTNLRQVFSVLHAMFFSGREQQKWSFALSLQNKLPFSLLSRHVLSGLYQKCIFNWHLLMPVKGKLGESKSLLGCIICVVKFPALLCCPKLSSFFSRAVSVQVLRLAEEAHRPSVQVRPDCHQALGGTSCYGCHPVLSYKRYKRYKKYRRYIILMTFSPLSLLWNIFHLQKSCFCGLSNAVVYSNILFLWLFAGLSCDIPKRPAEFLSDSKSLSCRPTSLNCRSSPG